MRHFDQELKELQMQAASKNRLETVLKELQEQKRMLESKVEELAGQKDKEALDVERLNRRSLANYFYQVVGRMDEKLTKEKQDAYEAAVKYDAACSELKAVKAQIWEKELEYGRIRRSPERYQAVLKEKQESIKNSGVPEAEEILRLEAQVTSLEVQEKELLEAIRAGEYAQRLAERILQKLSSAESMGTWDMVGGGLVADVVKHSHLDEAQNLVEQLQGALRQFKTELTDVEVHADLQVGIDGFLRFADYFFDGIFADWTVMKRIGDAKGKVESVKSQIETILGRLNMKHAFVKNEWNLAGNKLQTLVKKVPM